MISRVYTSKIYHYDDKLFRCGKLLGILTFIDGKSVKVWEGRDANTSLHQLCQRLAEQSRARKFDVRYTFRHSEKWGSTLVTLEDGRPEHEQYSDARTADEAQGRSHKQGGYEARMISKRVQEHVDKGAA